MRETKVEVKLREIDKAYHDFKFLYGMMVKKGQTILDDFEEILLHMKTIKNKE